MCANHLQSEKQLAFASRCDLLPPSMQKSNTSSCPTITYEEALKRELEYRERLENTHPHLLVGLNEAPVLPNARFSFDNLPVVGTDSAPDLFKRKSTPESSVHSPQAVCFEAVRSQPANWYPSKKKVKVQQSPLQAVQSPRPSLIPSFWCKICKVDCVTEFNFGAHIGGKKHKAKKLEILSGRNSRGPGSQSVGSRNPVRNNNAVSGSRNDEQNVGDHLSSSSEMQSGISYTKITGETSDEIADKNIGSV